MDESSWQPMSAAQRRRQRRLRLMLRGHQGRRGGARGQARRATATEAPSSPAGALPALRGGARREAATQSGDPPGPQARVLRHTVEPIIESFVPVPMVDVPVPQMVDQSAEVVKFIVTLPVVAEQVNSLRSSERAGALLLHVCNRDVVGGGGDHGTRQGCHWSHVVPRPWTTWGLLVAVGFAPCPVAPTGGDHRQPRAVHKYWAQLTSLRPCTTSSISCRSTVDGASSVHGQSCGYCRCTA